MCEACLAINGLSDEITALASLLKSNIHSDTDAIEKVIESCPAIAEAGFTVEDFQTMPISALGGLIAIRCARAVAQIDGDPLSMILGSWAGMCFEGEMSHVIHELFGRDADS